ncbi:MAG: hypothetical protein NWF00_00245 [Candidatus Bathyarchaeota archaeon]|nr:hypothetical protein [Candidatus Bathyarchaeota archaeon]
MAEVSERMKTETVQKINQKCKGTFCDWRGCLELQIELFGEIKKKPVHCEGCKMWVEK